MNRLSLCILGVLSCCAAGSASAQTLGSSEFSYQYEHPGRQPSAMLDSRDPAGYSSNAVRSWDTSLSWERPRSTPLLDTTTERGSRFYYPYDR